MRVEQRSDLVLDDAWAEVVEGIPGPPGEPSTVPGPPGKDGADGRNGADAVGWTYRGEWKRRQYEVNDVVSHEGGSYIALTSTKSEPPSKAWGIVAERGERGKRGEPGPASRGPRGFAGESLVITGGSSGESIPATFDDACVVGMPVYVASQNHVANASAAALATAGVVGVCAADVSEGGTSIYQTEGQVTREDWTAVTGTALLSPGALLFLAMTGLSELPPTGVDEVVIVVGRAVDETTLDIEISLPIILSEQPPEE